MGSAVIDVRSQPGGFSPGLAARVRTANGRRAFIKAVSAEQNPETPDMHRREARIVAALPNFAPVPRLLWSFEEAVDGWVVLALEDVDGRQPALPWRPSELDRLLRALDELAESLTPTPVLLETASDLFRDEFRGWHRLADAGVVDDEWALRHLDGLLKLEDLAPAAVEGDTLLHLDVRADNVLLTEDRVWFVDWPWARVGAPWLDAVALAPSVAMQGGPNPEALLGRLNVARSAEVEAITAAVGALAGYFLYRASLPPAPGLPTVRAFQAAQGKVALTWLALRTGWA